MSPDEIVRRAALLLRSGAVPVLEFVEALDETTQRRVRWTITGLPRTIQARANAALVAEEKVTCVRSGGSKGQKSHAYVYRRGQGGRWPACGVLGDGDPFLGVPTCKSCLASLASGAVTP